MKTIELVSNSIYHIISEPGDGTRYDYFMFPYYDEYCVMPCKSTFRFPQKLNYWNVIDIDEDEIIEMSKEETCNPYTLKECIRTIKELRS